MKRESLRCISWKKFGGDLNSPLSSTPEDWREILQQDRLGSVVCVPQPGHGGCCLPPPRKPRGTTPGPTDLAQRGDSPAPQHLQQCLLGAHQDGHGSLQDNHSFLEMIRKEGRGRVCPAPASGKVLMRRAIKSALQSQSQEELSRALSSPSHLFQLQDRVTGT